MLVYQIRGFKYTAVSLEFLMDTHEYQAKEILKRYQVPIPEFGVASKSHDVDHIIKHLKLKEAVIKIQVHAGGRGKAGGVH